MRVDSADCCRAWTEAGEHAVHIPKRLRRGARRPAVGDWIVTRVESGAALLSAVLPRASSFVRRAAGRATRRQVIAVNVDTLFVVLALDGDFKPRRVERYLAAAVSSGARPVILLTKAALRPDVEVEVELARAEAVAPGVPVHALDVPSGVGGDVPGLYLNGGRTGAFVGSSGVGKSTLVNHLLGHEAMSTRAVRARDNRGQHTTTRRELLWLPSGGAVIDTPGMREFGLWADDADVDDAFPEIRGLARGCRFRDCRHEGEPGCAVTAAIDAGELAGERLAAFVGLRRETEATQTRAVEHERRARDRALHRMYREVQRHRRRTKG